MERLPLRERKKIKTKELLIQVATRLFLEKGFEATTIDEIVDQADVSQRTFFRYFTTKESIVFWNHDHRREALGQHLANGHDANHPFDRLKRALLTISKEYQEQKDQLLDEYRIVTSSKELISSDMELDIEFEKIISTSLQSWTGKPFLSKRRADIVAGALLGASRAILGEWFEGGCRQKLSSMDKDLIRLVDMFAEGFGD